MMPSRRLASTCATILVAAATLVPVAATDAVVAPTETLHVVTIPARSPEAMSGSDFIRLAEQLTGLERERLVERELLAGNVPQFLRALKPITLTAPGTAGTPGAATLWVTPDYLAIGSDSDFVRVPMSFYTAATVARAFHLTLPTRKIVDAVYSQSDFRVDPLPLPPGPRMQSTAYFARHNRQITRQRAGRPPGELMSGQKKDLVLTKRLWKRPGREAIYGWHRLDGRPIQPLSTVHGARYVDYSHGVRLVGMTVLVDGVERNFYDVLADPLLSGLLTYEGAFDAPWRLLNPSPSGASGHQHSD